MITSTTLADLSRGRFTSKDIEKMEIQVLSALSWLVNPPMAVDFISYLILFLPDEICHEARNNIFELSRYQAELSVCDSFFVGFKASTVAFASILNVIDQISFSNLSAESREVFLRELCTKFDFFLGDEAVIASQERLRLIFSGNMVLQDDDHVVIASNDTLHSELRYEHSHIAECSPVTSMIHISNTEAIDSKHRRYVNVLQSNRCNTSPYRRSECKKIII